MPPAASSEWIRKQAAATPASPRARCNPPPGSEPLTYRYAELKEARSGLDFEDLQLRARDLLASRPEVAGAVRARFEQVMVDEFQDTNQLQNEIVDLVSQGNLFAVGDSDQAIYGFRHADVALFRARREVAEGGGRARSLRTSFRARPEVLAAVNSVFETVWAGGGYEPLRAA